MLSTIARSVATILLPAGLALLICTQTAHAQRRGGRVAQQRQAFGQNGSTPGSTGQSGGMCQNGSSGTGSGSTTPSTTPTTSQLSATTQAAALQRQRLLMAQQNALQAQVNSQAQLSALQQQRLLARQNAVLQVAYELQLIGYPPDLALQTAARQVRTGR